MELQTDYLIASPLGRGVLQPMVTPSQRSTLRRIGGPTAIAQPRAGGVPHSTMLPQSGRMPEYRGGQARTGALRGVPLAITNSGGALSSTGSAIRDIAPFAAKPPRPEMRGVPALRSPSMAYAGPRGTRGGRGGVLIDHDTQLPTTPAGLHDDPRGALREIGPQATPEKFSSPALGLRNIELNKGLPDAPLNTIMRPDGTGALSYHPDTRAADTTYTPLAERMGALNRAIAANQDLGEAREAASMGISQARWQEIKRNRQDARIMRNAAGAFGPERGAHVAATMLANRADGRRADTDTNGALQMEYHSPEAQAAREAGALDMQRQRRIASLQQALLDPNTTEEQRQTIAEQIALLQGGSAPGSRYQFDVLEGQVGKPDIGVVTDSRTGRIRYADPSQSPSTGALTPRPPLPDAVTATNPRTGERIRWNGVQWVPY